MPTGKKIAIVATLLTGVLSLICAIFRLYINVVYNSSISVESGKVDYVLGVSSLDIIGMTTILLFWTQIEVGVANVAVCLPAMRPSRLFTSRRSNKLLEKVKMAWLGNSKGGTSSPKSGGSYFEQKDEPISRPDDFHPSSADGMSAESKLGNISKTVDFNVHSSMASYPPRTDADMAPRYESLQYPSRAAQREYGLLEAV